MASYNDMARVVLDFYTNPNDLVQYGSWETMFNPNNTYNLEQAYNAIRSNPTVQVIERTDGTIVGWWNKSTGSENIIRDIGSVSNSNTIGGTNQSNALTNIQTSPAVTQIAPGIFKITNSPPTVSGKLLANGGVAPAIAAVATGLSLGATIDKALYAAKPGFLSDEQLESLNPDNWKQISSSVDERWTAMGYPTIGKIGRKVFDTILGVDSTDNSTQMYIDEDAYAYMAWYLQQNNILEGGLNIPNWLNDILYPDAYDNDYSQLTSWSTIKKITAYEVPNDGSYNYEYTYEFPTPIKAAYVIDSSGSPGVWFASESLETAEVTRVSIRKSNGSRNTKTYTIPLYNDGAVLNLEHPSYDNSLYPIYDYVEGAGPGTYSSFTTDPPLPVNTLKSISSTAGGTRGKISAILLYADKIYGVGKQSDAITPDLSTATDLKSFKTLLKQQYPDVWTNSVARQVLQPDGTLKTFTYVPVPTPDATDWMDTEPTGDGSQQSQKDTVVNPDMDTSIKDTISSSGSTGSDTPNPPDTGGGSSPTVVPPVGKASSLWSIYNPTLEQVNQFGSWLWSSNFVEQLKKLFNDPMQAIIGLHKVYSPVQTSGQGTIKCGYLDSGVPSKLVSEQYVTVDCGSVDLQEYFGNVFDYPPYTEVSIYLPFIGVRHLDPSDVMRSTISVIYHIDILTGACLAEVNVQRDAAGGTLYTFSGDAAVRYPVSSGSYMGIVSGLIGVATSVVSGNLLPALGGVTRLHTNVDRSGSFTGNAGAMGSKIPYLIISRPQTAMADQFETLSGYPSNTYTPLSACKGFTQVKYCHVENLNATDAEKQEIEQLLKEGVIL